MTTTPAPDAGGPVLERPVLPAPSPVELAGKVALVTGAAGDGIGQATARRLAAGGAVVVVSDNHEGRMRAVVAALQEEYEGRATGVVLDVADRASIDAAVAAVTATHGRLDVLVNNAAINHLQLIDDYPIERWDALLEANLTGPWLLTKLAVQTMKPQGSGSIVNVSSYSADVGGMGQGQLAYAVTKGGLNVMTRAAARELGPHGIRVNTVSMTIVRGSRFIEKMLAAQPDRTPGGVLGEWMWPEDVAEAIAFLAGDRARMITGATIDVTAGEYMRT
jgi:NAD(P)-dependent dehydrogenase (short-subunit alcohol dehydrogenase family)